MNCRYVFGLSLASESRNALGSWKTHYYLSDGQGDVRGLVDGNGNVTDRYSYDAFGNLLGKTGSTPNRYLYNGEQFDPDLGMYYLRARYYNPQTGRFLSADPFAGFIDDPMTLHKYLYANADPVTWCDPSGLFAAMEYAALTKKNTEPENTAALTKLRTDVGCLLNRAVTAIEAINTLASGGGIIEILPDAVELVQKCKINIKGNKLWKKKIHMPKSPHTNKTPGHWFAMKRKAVELAKRGEVEEVYLNQSLSKALKGANRRRPDIISKRITGEIDQFEVPSKTDSVSNLINRMTDNQGSLGDHAGSIDIVSIK